jgi:predicted TIM-barrel fold metal-dependent hydrolase
LAIAPQLSPQLLLGALVFDGVLERHPKLTVIVEELGISWLPHLLAVLDSAVGRSKNDQLSDGKLRPDYAGSAYRLPLAPSEYLRRQVRVTPLVATELLLPTLNLAPEMLCFSSDYPHVEGTAQAVAICDRQLGDLDLSRRAAFYQGVGELIGL